MKSPQLIDITNKLELNDTHMKSKELKISFYTSILTPI